MRNDHAKNNLALTYTQLDNEFNEAYVFLFIEFLENDVLLLFTEVNNLWWQIKTKNIIYVETVNEFSHITGLLLLCVFSACLDH